jgi:hypothetical protein
LFARYQKQKESGYAFAVAESANLATETWFEFTIRRVMCPSVPWATINQLTNRINGLQAWAPTWMTLEGLNLPVFGNTINNSFPAGTLRFDSAEPIKRVVPAAYQSDGTTPILDPNSLPITRPMTWWDITYKFSWRVIWEWWISPNLEEDASDYWSWEGPEWITWNRVFAGPFSSGTAYSPSAWYDCLYDDETAFFLSSGGRPRYLNAEDESLPINSGAGKIWINHPFDQLFLLQAP